MEIAIEVDPHENVSDRMGAELLKALVDEVRVAPAQWSKLTESQQEQLIGRLRTVVRTEAMKAVHLIAKGPREAARVKIESLTVKDGAKCVLQVGDSAHDVLDYVGQSAVLVMCNPDAYFAGIEDVRADKDQQELPLEAGSASAASVALTADVEIDDDVRFLSASPDGMVRKVRGVNRDVDPPLIEVTGLEGEFAIALFERVDPIAAAEAEAEEEAEADDDQDDVDESEHDEQTESEDEAEETEAPQSRRRKARA